MNYKELKDVWKKEEEMSFEGWDFSYLNDRWKDEELPWDYKAIVEKYLNLKYKLLDMGSGGGEFLLSLEHPYENTSVTEAWEPNVKLCKERLEPLGIIVKQVYEDDKLPFEDNSFDIVINRHEAFDIKEVRRVLKPDGIFITQQVGGKNNEVLSNKLTNNFKPEFSNWTLKNVSNKLKVNQFKLLYQDEYYPVLRFYDIGAIVYFAKIIQWEFPGFTVENNFSELCELQKELSRDGYIKSFEHRFVIVSQNKKN
ncbi:class I SAM-dependent methyltransferase [Clostridium sp.]|uniref:class I SAM-dependent methyltransferase n=1 Tax=Clostridium sp. TaxID=1506 RepID=UPI00283F8EA7|nr:class I SAM-dependent methyltransferase [Clostridium sp.]MDR3598630.1 class I SAM-dependent methyltransferase [Clostridium sp.]